MWSHKCALKARGWCEKLTGWFSSAYSRDHTDILWSIRQKRSFKQNIYLITAELQQSKGPPNRAPYPYTKAKETHELIFSRLSWLVVLLVGAYTWRQWWSHARWWPYSSKLSCFIASFFETGHQCYSQLTPGKKYMLITLWAQIQSSLFTCCFEVDWPSAQSTWTEGEWLAGEWPVMN